MQINNSDKSLLLNALMIACMLQSGMARAQQPVPNFQGSWLELNVAPDRAMKLNITQNGNQLTEEIFGTLTISNGIATGSSIQQCAPPFRKPGYNYDANPSFATITLRLMGSTLIFDRDLHWTAPCDGHAIGTEQDHHLFQRYP
jgi:hypothetical protein